jgi:hypothetical protein
MGAIPSRTVSLIPALFSAVLLFVKCDSNHCSRNNSKGKLICYYADQRDNATHGQKLSHQVTDDLLNWGPPVDDV